MSQPPRSAREQDLLREIVEIVGGTRPEPARPVGPADEPAVEPMAQRDPTDEETAS